MKLRLILAISGVIQVVRTPLFPPLSTLQLALLIPDGFSIFVSIFIRVFEQKY